MSRLLFASSFIKTNMPLGAQHGQPQLTDDQAYDVAAFVLSKPRPIKAHTERDFPARWNKPVDAPFPPMLTVPQQTSINSACLARFRKT